ncbi:plasmid mobilization protein [Larkinella sp. GY13]
MTPERKKNGRPEKSTDTKKSQRIGFWVTESEAVVIRKQAQEAGLTISDYCNQIITNGQIVAPFTEEELNLKRGLVGMANNLNQIAFRANAAGISSVESSARDLLQEIKKLLKTYQ